MSSPTPGDAGTKPLSERVAELVDGSWSYSWHWPRTAHGTVLPDGYRQMLKQLIGVREGLVQKLVKIDPVLRELREVVTDLDKDDAEDAPTLLNGCNALLGLLKLIAGRDDINDEVRAALTSGHRIDEARAAIALAERTSP